MPLKEQQGFLLEIYKSTLFKYRANAVYGRITDVIAAFRAERRF